MNLRILILRIETLSDFLRRGSKFFHSIMLDGKGRVLCLEGGCYVYFKSIITNVWQESSWRDIKDAHFLKPYKKESSTPTSISKKLQFQFLIDLFF